MTTFICTTLETLVETTLAFVTTYAHKNNWFATLTDCDNLNTNGVCHGNYLEATAPCAKAFMKYVAFYSHFHLNLGSCFPVKKFTGF